MRSMAEWIVAAPTAEAALSLLAAASVAATAAAASAVVVGEAVAGVTWLGAPGPMAFAQAAVAANASRCS